jgi:hypothetical protein
MCTVLLPPGVDPIALANMYIISYIYNVATNGAVLETLTICQLISKLSPLIPLLSDLIADV